MKTARELYTDENIRYGFYNYQPILDSFGEILLQIDDDDYQGDSRILYKFPHEIGILQFGWGSCSGCDMLQACESYEEIDDLSY